VATPDYIRTHPLLHRIGGSGSSIAIEEPSRSV
jgi:hypothetical protein